MTHFKTVILNASFYKRHNKDKEILSNKDGRPYLSLVLELNGKTFAIPFRTNIKHHFAFYFYTSSRKQNEKKGSPGLDYTKAVLITESDIERNCAIDSKEWIELNKNINTIISDFKKYLQLFQDSLKNGDFNVKPVFKFSALQYFISELNAN